MSKGHDDACYAYPREYGFDARKSGMTLRDYFAGQALMGVISNPNTPDQLIGMGFEGAKDHVAEYAYAAADAMLAARDKEGT